MGATALNAPRVVLDTNVLVSALLFRHGHLAWLRDAWHEGAVNPLLCRPTTEELLRALSYPKLQLSSSERDELLADVLPFCEAVVLPGLPPRVPACRDPCDRIFLVLAMAAQADAIVTGDGDLLELVPEFAIPILSPAVFRTRLAEPSGNTGK